MCVLVVVLTVCLYYCPYDSRMNVFRQGDEHTRSKDDYYWRCTFVHQPYSIYGRILTHSKTINIHPISCVCLWCAHDSLYLCMIRAFYNIVSFVLNMNNLHRNLWLILSKSKYGGEYTWWPELCIYKWVWVYAWLHEINDSRLYSLSFPLIVNANGVSKSFFPSLM